MASRTSWPAIARQDGFGVVFPDGYNRAWADLRRNDNRAGHARLESPPGITTIPRTNWTVKRPVGLKFA